MRAVQNRSELVRPKVLKIRDSIDRVAASIEVLAKKHQQATSCLDYVEQRAKAMNSDFETLPPEGPKTMLILRDNLASREVIDNYTSLLQLRDTNLEKRRVTQTKFLGPLAESSAASNVATSYGGAQKWRLLPQKQLEFDPE